MSDAELVIALSERHPEAPTVVVRRFSGLVRRSLWHVYRHDDELRDAQQEVFCSVFRQIECLREPHALRGFVIAIALHKAHDELRRRRRLARLTCDLERVAGSLVRRSDEVAASLAFSRLVELLDRLRKRDREAFVLRFIEGMKMHEVAETLGVSIATARRSWISAVRQVRRWASEDPFLTDYVREPRKRRSRAYRSPGLEHRQLRAHGSELIAS